MKKHIENKYKKDKHNRDYLFYAIYFKSLEKILDFSIISSFADFGCNNGRLIEAISDNFPKVDVIGFDYFEWAKKYASEKVHEKIILKDPPFPLVDKKKYNIVNCSELVEHIPKESEDMFIDNLANSSSDIIILTWSSENDDSGQHLNPRPKDYIIKKMKDRGFSFWEDVTNILFDELKNKLDGVGYNWWADDIMVFKKDKFANINQKYFIQNISTDNGSHKKNLIKENLSNRSLQDLFIKITSLIDKRVLIGKAFSILRASDGDYLFLRQIAIGSAKPGKRALTFPYNKICIKLFRDLFWKNDLITLNLEKNEHRNWMKFIIVDCIDEIISKIIRHPVGSFKNSRLAYLIDRLITPLTFMGYIPFFIAYVFSFKKGNFYFEKAKKIIYSENFPSETVYALIATKWIFKNYKNQIGIIASAEKILIIKELMSYPEYKEYLGMDNFTEYIDVPAKGAADEVLNLSKKIGERIKGSETKIFLVGVGSSKIALMPLLKEYSNAVFIDVGCGIDAIAGIVCQERPYFAEWTNYRIKSYNYSDIDFMDKGNPAWNNPNYKTILI